MGWQGSSNVASVLSQCSLVGSVSGFDKSASLQDQALVLLLLLCQERSSSGRFEDFADTLVGFG